MENEKNNKCSNNGCVDEKNQSENQASEGTKPLCCQELQSTRERCLYLTAEFENYKKRVSREKQEWIAVAQADLLTDILPIIDDMERALEQMREEKLNPEENKHLEGFHLISKEFFKLLDKYGITQIEEIKTFDPELHEALVQVESSDTQSGQIVDILQKGYKHKDRVIRPAKVSVAK